MVDLQNHRTSYVNIGYWESGETSADEAGQALARKLAKAAGFQAGDRILDVGCGYGEQDFVWLGENDPAKIFALDLRLFALDGILYPGDHVW
jgi:erythromycin 3''-O-methyltransferase